MLEKIINITSSSEYKNPPKSGKHGSKSGVFRHANFSLSDSISFSPAVAFMTSHHWKLNVFEKENDKTVIDFELDGIRFLVKVSEIDLAKHQDLEYSVTKNVETTKHKISVRVQFISFVSADTARKLDPRLTLPHLNNFLNDLTEISTYVLQLSENHPLVQNVIEKEAEQLKSEFEYLNSCIVNFLEMYLSKKFVFSLTDKNQGKHLSLSKLNISKI